MIDLEDQQLEMFNFYLQEEYVICETIFFCYPSDANLLIYNESKASLEFGDSLISE